MRQDNPSTEPAGQLKPISIVIVAMIAAGLAVSLIQNRQVVPPAAPPDRDSAILTGKSHEAPDASNTRQSSAPIPDESEPTSPEFAPDHHHGDNEVSRPISDAGHSHENSFRIPHQTIRDQNGHVVFQGTIDLTPTIERIERGEADPHRRDGTTFQNREGRLPRKPAGYYKEYVHPTPGEHGPGPQRIIIGRDGDIWYSPDHYGSFQEIRR